MCSHKVSIRLMAGVNRCHPTCLCHPTPVTSSEVPFTEKGTITGREPRAEGASWHGNGEEGELKMAELVLGSWNAVSGGDGPTPFYHPTESLSILRGFL